MADPIQPPATDATDAADETQINLSAIFLIFLRLGLTSFGGPVAHLGYFREEFVIKRRWLDEHAYADLVALCQFLPGPASSQVGMALGLLRGGIPGALAAFVGFTMPSAIALVLFGIGLTHYGQQMGANWLHGLKVVAVAVVAQALWGMGQSLAPDKTRATIAVVATVFVCLVPSAFGQLAVIVFSGLVGWAVLHGTPAPTGTPLRALVSPVTAGLALGVFFLLLLVLPLAAAANGGYLWQLFDRFYRAGALVFGGGHVVLPLLQSAVVPSGWISNDTFLAGYGATQAMPGPLFTFAAFLGSVSTQSPSGWAGASVALAAIFLPAFLLIVGAFPFWERLRSNAGVKRAMLGVNAGVVGLLLAAFYDPVWSSAIHSATDFCLGVAAFLLLVFWKWPPWLVVALTALAAGLGLH